MADKTLTQFGKTKILPKTGQTTSYADYDDGYYETGNPVSPRFVDNGDGTISDKATGLMWVKQPELIIPGASVIASNQIQVANPYWNALHDYAVGDLVLDGDEGGTGLFYVCVIAHNSGMNLNVADDLVDNPGSWRQTIWTASAANLTTPATMTWANAVSNSAALEYAGFSDWRLPNVRELVSIADYSVDLPAINTTYFPNTKNSWYWLSTTLSPYSGGAFVLDGALGEILDGDKTSSYYVRPVRGGI
jgi:hypothetical protein